MLVKSNVLIDVCSDRRALGKDDVFAMHEEKHRCNWERELASQRQRDGRSVFNAKFKCRSGLN